MDNRELDQLLLSVPVPEPSDTYWQEFPADMTRMARSSTIRSTATPRSDGPTVRWAFGVGLAAACVAIAFLIGYRAGTKPSTPVTTIASEEKCLREVETMFPHQLRAIIFEKGGARLLLSDNADVPQSTPIYLKVCDGKNCQSILTFSGQQVPIKGELCDVLVDVKQNVLVVGEQQFWPGGMPNNTHVEARTL